MRWYPYAPLVVALSPFYVKFQGETIEADGMIVMGELLPDEVAINANGDLFVNEDGVKHMLLLTHPYGDS
jgi:hypothetical protein